MCGRLRVGKKKRYSPAECIGARKTRIEGNPDIDHVSTSYAERSNLTVRMHTRRFTRLTNGFSKKVENHAHSVALLAMYYNFVRVHKTLRVTPAMAVNVTKRLWEMSDIVEVLEAWEETAMQVRIPETIAVAAIAGLAALLSALFTAALYTY